ncbi:MAG: superoxide dismutase family protein [Comamonas sp.]|jgi:Cu-Zn family superoxide dismutase|nr:superoxide dismutase family protein [Comamonas sp.]
MIQRIPSIAKLAAAAAVAAVLSACAHTDRATPIAEATINPTEGNNISGYFRVYEVNRDTVRVIAQVKGLAPGSEHGFHVHENGNCSSPDAMSAGGHYNPTGHQHGKSGPESHVGDLPSLMADAAGTAFLVWETKDLSIGTGKPSDIKGRAVVVHKDKDDYTTQPTGNSGARLGCGVIQ